MDAVAEKRAICQKFRLPLTSVQLFSGDEYSERDCIAQTPWQVVVTM